MKESEGAIEPIGDEHLREIERLLALGGRYHRRIQFTDWQTTTPDHLVDCFAHALRESAVQEPAARFWWVETGEEGSPLIVGYLGNGPSSELNAWLLGAGPAIVARLREVERERDAYARRIASLEASLEQAGVDMEEHELLRELVDSWRLKFAEHDSGDGLGPSEKAAWECSDCTGTFAVHNEGCPLGRLEALEAKRAAARVEEPAS